MTRDWKHARPIERSPDFAVMLCTLIGIVVVTAPSWSAWIEAVITGTCK